MYVHNYDIDFKYLLNEFLLTLELLELLRMETEKPVLHSQRTSVQRTMANSNATGGGIPP